MNRRPIFQLKASTPKHRRPNKICRRRANSLHRYRVIGTKVAVKCSKQFSFTSRRRGGKRRGAGRKKKLAREPKHVARVSVDARTPQHLTIRMERGLPSLRTRKFSRVFASAIVRARSFGLHIREFAIESNHLHLIAETDSTVALAKGMASLCARITWWCRKFRKGSIFAGRFHSRPLRTPRETKTALRYVLFNHAKHLGVRPFVDVYSSASSFELLHELVPEFRSKKARTLLRFCLGKPTSWLLSVGWLRG